MEWCCRGCRKEGRRRRRRVGASGGRTHGMADESSALTICTGKTGMSQGQSPTGRMRTPVSILASTPDQPHGPGLTPPCLIRGKGPREAQAWGHDGTVPAPAMHRVTPPQSIHTWIMPYASPPRNRVTTPGMNPPASRREGWPELSRGTRKKRVPPPFAPHGRRAAAASHRQG